MRNTPIALSALLGIVMHCFYACTAHPNGKSATLQDTLPKPTYAQDASIPGSFSTQTTLTFDSTAIPVFMYKFPELRDYSKEMKAFYHGRNYSYAWFDRAGIIEQAGNLYNRLNNLTEEGISATMPYADIFQKLMEKDTVMTSNLQAQTMLELMLTAQYFFYAKQVWTGLGEKGMQQAQWNLPRKKISYVQLLDSLLRGPVTAFEQTAPVYLQYTRLKAALKKYSAIEKAGGWLNIQWSKKSYHPGDSSEEIRMLRKRLWQSDDLHANNGSAVYDESLMQAVKNFQRRHGITEDGIANKYVLEALNVSVNQRIRQMIVNMERSRWLPAFIPDQHFMINIPAFTFYAYEKDSVAWSMKVVVGKAVHQTAVFSGNLQFVVFSPYWNIPPGIMAKEILPALRKNRNYLYQHHMEWNGKQIRQKPGPHNALGLVKFIFPNSHNIYLHDTPAKTLFESDQRAFSHGCIRVAQPKRLAAYLLKDQPEWSEVKMEEAMHAGKERWVTIKHPVPVFITYFTAWVDEQGSIQFRKDIYKRDERLAEMMLEAAQQ